MKRLFLAVLLVAATAMADEDTIENITDGDLDSCMQDDHDAVRVYPVGPGAVTTFTEDSGTGDRDIVAATTGLIIKGFNVFNIDGMGCRGRLYHDQVAGGCGGVGLAIAYFNTGINDGETHVLPSVQVPDGLCIAIIEGECDIVVYTDVEGS